VDVLLSNCQMDGQNPVAQQWALWAVRAMTQGHAGIQAHIAGLAAQDAVASPELEAMGMQLRLDRGTGKMRLVQVAAGQAGAGAPGGA
jgi:hypothetical protein